MTESLTLKTGDIWQIDGELLDADGAALPLTGLSVRAAGAAASGRFELDGTVATDAQGDWFQLRLPRSESREVVPGVHRADVQLSDGTVVNSSETFLIHLVGDVTGSEVPPRTHGRAPRRSPSAPRLIPLVGGAFGASLRIGRRP